MSDKGWRVTAGFYGPNKTWAFGCRIYHSAYMFHDAVTGITVYLGPWDWQLMVYTRRRRECLTKPGKPSSAG